MSACPVCDDKRVSVEEDVNDEVVVFACGGCGSTWAQRTPDAQNP